MNVRIYQINMKRDTNNVAFMNYESLPKFQGSSEIDSSLYDKVFEGEVNCFTLEKLYEIFNLEHPAGYKGRSMSVSDVVEIIDGNNGKSYFHFCDSFGFQQVPGFLPDNPLKNAEMMLEDDYGMIDGIINNGPKQPTVADLEAQVKAGFSISLTELAVASHREQKKPSVLEKLRERTPEQTKNKTAPKRSAEREL